MSDSEDTADLWPVGVKKTIASHKKELLALKKQNVKDLIPLDKFLDVSIPENEQSNYSSLDFFSKAVENNGTVENNVISKDSTKYVKLESQLNQLLEAILRDTFPNEKPKHVETLNLELKYLVSSLIDSELESNDPVEYSPQLAPVLQRIALTNLVKLDTAKCTIEFLT